jgi:cell division septum initiation protein DivIVA
MNNLSSLPDFEERMRQLCQATIVEDLKKEIKELKEALKKSTQNGSSSNSHSTIHPHSEKSHTSSE